MAEAHVSIGGTPRKIRECYVSIGGTARSVREVYAGVGGSVRLAWTLGVNRLYFTTNTGVGEFDPKTFAIIVAANSIAYLLGSVGGMRRRLFLFDNYSSQYTDTSRAESRIMELDLNTRAVMRSVIIGKTIAHSWSMIGGTNTRLFKSARYADDQPTEIDPQSFAIIKTFPEVGYTSGDRGMACTASRILVFSEGTDNRYTASMNERDPATLGTIRNVAGLVNYRYFTGSDEQIFAVNRKSDTTQEIARLDISTLVAVQTGAGIGYVSSIGSAKS